MNRTAQSEQISLRLESLEAQMRAHKNRTLDCEADAARLFEEWVRLKEDIDRHREVVSPVDSSLVSPITLLNEIDSRMAHLAEQFSTDHNYSIQSLTTSSTAATKCLTEMAEQSDKDYGQPADQFITALDNSITQLYDQPVDGPILDNPSLKKRVFQQMLREDANEDSRHKRICQFIDEVTSQMHQGKASIAHKDWLIASKDEKIESSDQTIASRDQTIAHKDEEIRILKAEKDQLYRYLHRPRQPGETKRPNWETMQMDLPLRLGEREPTPSQPTEGVAPISSDVWSSILDYVPTSGLCAPSFTSRTLRDGIRLTLHSRIPKGSRWWRGSKEMSVESEDIVQWWMSQIRGPLLLELRVAIRIDRPDIVDLLRRDKVQPGWSIKDITWEAIASGSKRPIVTSILPLAWRERISTEVMQWCVDNNIRPFGGYLESFPLNVSRETLQLAIDHGCITRDSRVLFRESDNDTLEDLKWLHERHVLHEFICDEAAIHDRLDVLHWAVENGYKLYRSAEKAVIQKGSADTLEWMIHSEEADEEKIIDWGRKAAKAGNLELLFHDSIWRHCNNREELNDGNVRCIRTTNFLSRLLNTNRETSEGNTEAALERNAIRLRREGKWKYFGQIENGHEKPPSVAVPSTSSLWEDHKEHDSIMAHTADNLIFGINSIDFNTRKKKSQGEEDQGIEREREAHMQSVVTTSKLIVAQSRRKNLDPFHTFEFDKD
ncbi:hypothetical protein PROFUN_04445 [Planoprotostelium fungivorum]|uniref:Uncharacterized protein n=1 Tax=Planoprotostelium fungivorum TaxID=1890364 RepID=A0A2P6NVL8_9EUKA|nr:hypothetical protein PROFUN_04445 [Planoprotostelium fungivorum]